MTPEWIVDEVLDSGLRGRGGAGFPTGMKWKFAAASPGDVKYIICNGDEGDPGAFMDASIMDGDPHAVLEGMIIGTLRHRRPRGLHLRARRVPARRQAPAPGDRRRPRSAACSATTRLGSGWGFHLKIKEGAGAFVCGEETALIASHRGQARHAAHAAAVPGGQRPLGQAHQHQQRRDAAPTCPGSSPTGRPPTRRLRHREEPAAPRPSALAGKVVNGGLVEVPMGSTLRQ